MYKSPELPIRYVERVFPEGALALWLKALARPEVDMKCQAAEAVTKAHQRGVKGLEITVAPLRAALDQPDQHPTARLAIVEALITLEARETAPSLFQQVQPGTSILREKIEPVLARWDYRPAREVWLARLREPATPQRNLILAIQGLATVRETQAIERLRELALGDRIPGPIRLEAARALASLRNEGLEKDAEHLTADASPRGLPSRLVGASLLRQHRSEAAIRLMLHLVEDPEPAVAALAVAPLLEMDATLLVPKVEHLLASRDANLRSFAVEVLFQRPSEKHVHLLGDRLDDPHPGVRVKARRSLEKLAAKEELHNPVIAEGVRMLATEQWGGLEQAAILLTLLDYKPAAPRLVQLLAFKRPEVFVTAAWGLRRLAVPETVSPAADFLKEQVERLDPRVTFITEQDPQLAQLAQFMGQQKYAPSDPTLQKLIPRGLMMVPEARAAAIWALGFIREGKPDSGVAAKLIERLNDIRSVPPESATVRQMSAITLGRMNQQDALGELRKFCPSNELTGEHIHDAIAWAIERLTGEKMTPPTTAHIGQLDWFLTPYEETRR
jgi:HEAT repeat protein